MTAEEFIKYFFVYPLWIGLVGYIAFMALLHIVDSVRRIVPSALSKSKSDKYRCIKDRRIRAIYDYISNIELDAYCRIDYMSLCCIELDVIEPFMKKHLGPDYSKYKYSSIENVLTVNMRYDYVCCIYLEDGFPFSRLYYDKLKEWYLKFKADGGNNFFYSELYPYSWCGPKIVQYFLFKIQWWYYTTICLDSTKWENHKEYTRWRIESWERTHGELNLPEYPQYKNNNQNE